MRTSGILFYGAAIFLGIYACDIGTADSSGTADFQAATKEEEVDLSRDIEFAQEAVDAGLLEVQLGTLALAKASHPKVKQFAQMMVEDHSRANSELEALAQKKDVPLPATMGETHREKYERLNGKKGSDFDRDYMELMVTDHKHDIDAFEDQAEGGKDPELRSWAAGKLIALRHHLDVAERTRKLLEDKK